MEFLYGSVLSQFLDCDDDGYNSDDVFETCLQTCNHSACVLSHPSPPWSPCDDELNNDVEAEWHCCIFEEPHSFSCRQAAEKAVACKCYTCAQPSGPLIKDCMWSAGVASHTAALSRCKMSVESAALALQSHTMDFETVSSFVKSEIIDDPLSCDESDGAICARLAEYRQMGATSPSTNSSGLVKTTKSTNVSGAGCCCWVSEKCDYLSHSDDDSSDEIDVVSVSSRKSNQPEPNQRVLPALASVSEQVAALHNYSSPLEPCSVVLEECDWLSLTAISAMPSPACLAKSMTNRCASTPASPASKRLSHSSTKHHRIRPTRTADSWSIYSDSEDGNCSVLDRRESRVHLGGGKRSLHNVLERQRRSCLKLNFHSLRDVVPSIAGNSRMSKVAILNSAHSHMLRLMNDGLVLQMELNQLRSLNHRWQRKLAMLRK